MSGTVSINPYATTTPQNSFLVQTQGYYQGAPYDDPIARLWLASGTLKSSETMVMWGGVPIFEYVTVAGSGADGLGPQVGRATSQATTTGWSTNLQMNSMVVTPGNSVPLAGIGNSVGFFRNGTNQRLAVQIDPALVTTLTSADALINATALYWDVTNYRVTATTTGGNFALPTTTKLLSINTNSQVVSYNSGTGAVTWTTGDAAIILI
jgi:hypothetical protein